MKGSAIQCITYKKPKIACEHVNMVEKSCKSNKELLRNWAKNCEKRDWMICVYFSPAVRTTIRIEIDLRRQRHTICYWRRKNTLFALSAYAQRLQHHSSFALKL